MVTWHLTMKLFPAKCHERATLRKLWRQMGNSSLLPAKCWPLLHVTAGISARFSNFAFVLFCYMTNHLMTGPLGNSEYCFPRISRFPETKSRETLSLDCISFSLIVFIIFPSRERQMNAAFQQEAGQSDFGRWERFGLNLFFFYLFACF